jgi:hypothetical protein
MSDLDERVLAFVEVNPGATSRAVATHIFGSAKVRSSERTRICAVLRRLVDSGRLTATERPGSPTSLPCNLYSLAPNARRSSPRRESGWVEIGQADPTGRRSLWVRFNTADGVVQSFELCAGREGDDAHAFIDRDNPAFVELADVLARAKASAQGRI